MGVVKFLCAFEVAGAFEAPVAHEGQADRLIYVPHRIDKLLQDTELGYVDEVSCIFDGAIFLLLLHRKLPIEVHHIGYLSHTQVVLLVDEERCED